MAARRVAIIGAGPGGLVAARYLREHGFDCVLFEQAGDIGGQWNGQSPYSGVWRSMRTNTSRVTTCFSDLRHEPGIAVYPTNQEILAYLKRYASRFDVNETVRLNTRVESIDRSRTGYRIRFVPSHGRPATEEFSHVVVASGRFNQPSIPHAEGLDSFTGSGGVTHAFRYKDPERYRGLRVLVAGCAISALEIASDLAMLGAARVVSTYRRQRYVLPKLSSGIPTDHLAYTRFGALCNEVFPPEMSDAHRREFALRVGGSPEQFGALKPADTIAEAGVTLSQYFLPLVAEGRIEIKPWIQAISGRRVTFADGSHEEFDAIIFGTGYDLALPFLSDEIRAILQVDREHIDLFKFTFHPDLPGLAFLGLHQQMGPFYPVLELQARWITYAWSGPVPRPSRAEMMDAIALSRAQNRPALPGAHTMALLFSRAAGVEPPIEQHPELARALWFGPLSPASFRISGPDALPRAAELFQEDAAAFGMITSREFRAEEAAQLHALEERLRAAAPTSAQAVA